MGRHAQGFAVAVVLLALHGCAFVDGSFPKRIDMIDRGYDQAVNTEILTNIVRASRNQPLHFYAHSKIAPSQVADLKLGIPKFTFGPGRGGSTKQFESSGSVADNSASLSLQLDPIETRDFHRNLLKPTGVDVIGLLLQNYPREVVLLAMVESIRVEIKDVSAAEYFNDPITADDPACLDVDFVAIDEMLVKGALSEDDAKRAYRYGPDLNVPARSCPYHHFQYWIHMAVTHGLSVKLEAVTVPASGDSKATQQIRGAFCFDAAKASTFDFKQVKDLNSCVSANPAADKTESASGSPVISNFEFKAPGKESTPLSVRIDLTPRSLYGVLTYFGRLSLLERTMPAIVPLYTKEARSGDDRSLITIVRRPSSVDDCFASAEVNGDAYCVPMEGAANTRRIFAMLTELVALNYMTSDVPTSFSVRLTP